LRRPGCHGTAEQLEGLMPRAGFLEFGGLHKEPRLDEAERDRQFPQLKGLFMIDRDGVVRWSDVERERPGAPRHRDDDIREVGMTYWQSGRRRNLNRREENPQESAIGCLRPDLEGADSRLGPVWHRLTSRARRSGRRNTPWLGEGSVGA
jgi:hypothetical protein